MATMKPASSVDGLQLIKGEFGVGHWFEGVVEVFPSDAHTISEFADRFIDLTQSIL